LVFGESCATQWHAKSLVEQGFSRFRGADGGNVEDANSRNGMFDQVNEFGSHLF